MSCGRLGIIVLATRDDGQNPLIRKRASRDCKPAFQIPWLSGIWLKPYAGRKMQVAIEKE